MSRTWRSCAALGAFLAALVAAEQASAGINGRAYAQFVLASFDVDGDGKISRAEFSKTGKANFQDIDKNYDGIASSEEIAAWYVKYLNK